MATCRDTYEHMPAVPVASQGNQSRDADKRLGVAGSKGLLIYGGVCELVVAASMTPRISCKRRMSTFSAVSAA